jgi:hypothetical protein
MGNRTQSYENKSVKYWSISGQILGTDLTFPFLLENIPCMGVAQQSFNKCFRLSNRRHRYEV